MLNLVLVQVDMAYWKPNHKPSIIPCNREHTLGLGQDGTILPTSQLLDVSWLFQCLHGWHLTFHGPPPELLPQIPLLAEQQLVMSCTRVLNLMKTLCCLHWRGAGVSTIQSIVCHCSSQDDGPSCGTCMVFATVLQSTFCKQAWNSVTCTYCHSLYNSPDLILVSSLTHSHLLLALPSVNAVTLLRCVIWWETARTKLASSATCQKCSGV